MPQEPSRKIRIYCICGQKMKIDPGMFGRDGKCVACKQKLRIPRADELDPNVREIYLSAHPEFLRTAPRLPKAPESSGDTLAFARKIVSTEPEPSATAEAPAALLLGAKAHQDTAERSQSNLSLEICRPLQEICSFQHNLEADLHRKDTGKRSPDKSALMAYRALVRRIREDMDQDFRTMMGELNTRLETVEQDILDTLAQLRQGALEYAAYQDRIVPLRRQREYFVHCLQNLQAWLQCNTAAEAGGLLPLDYEDIPCAAPTIMLPPPPPPGESLIALHLQAFRAALTQHTAMKEHHPAQTEAAHANVSAEVELQRAQNAVHFYRERLSQLLQDCTDDVQALKTALDKEDTTEKSSLLDYSVRRQREKGWRKALNDNIRIRALLRRAVEAKSPAEIPRAPTALVAQMAFSKSNRIQMDSWVAWLCSLILMMGILMPITRETVDDAAITRSVTLGFFFSASALAAVALAPMRLTRGLLLCLVWAAASLVWGYYLVYLRTDFGPTMQEMGRDPYWYLAPGVLLLCCAFVMASCAALISLYPFPRFRAVPFALFFCLIFGGLFYVGDAFGVYQPQPVLAGDAVQQTQRSGRPGIRQVSIPIENRGNRPLFVTSETNEKTGYVVQLEAAEAPVLAAGAAPLNTSPNAFRIADRRSWTPISQSADYNIRIPGGQQGMLRFELPPGRYDFTLRSTQHPDRIVQSLQLDVEALTPEETPRTIAQAETAESSSLPFPNEHVPMREERLQPTSETESATEEPEFAATDPVSEPGNDPATDTELDGAEEVVVQLRGVMDGEHTAPLFALSVRYTSGSVINDRYYLGQEIYPPWVIHEFNPARKTLTITDGDQLVIMERGRGIRLSETGDYLGVE